MLVNVLVKEGEEWFVYSKDKKKKLAGPYKEKADALKRLKEIEHFADNSFEYVTTNLAKGIRYETMEGKEYMVVPAVMIVEGVLNGSGGPLYYPAEELEKAPECWNHKPIVIYHPQMNGQPVSACDPDILTSRKVGIIMRTKYEGKKLKTEAWIDQERLKQVDSRVYTALENGQKVEVSTGLFSDKDPVSGTFNGVDYDGIARNYKPDHLAILPDIKGACSIDQGAGLLANASYEETRSKIETALRNKHNDKDNDMKLPSKFVWVEAMYDTFVVYTLDTSYFVVSYEKKGEDVTLTTEPKEVERVVSYRLKEDGKFLVSQSQKEEEGMERKEKVKAILANSKVWTPEVLEKFTDEQISALYDNSVPKPEPAKPVEPKPVVVKELEPKPVVNKQPTVDEYIANAPKCIREVLLSGLRTYENHKGALVALLLKNERNTFTEAQLKEMGIEQLQAIARLAEVKDESIDTTTIHNTEWRTRVPKYDYSGMAPVANTEEEPLSMPALFTK